MVMQHTQRKHTSEHTHQTATHHKQQQQTNTHQTIPQQQ